MKVIFLKNVKGVGKTHDIKDVSDGYAQNFLIPKGIAVRATEEKIKEIESGKKVVQEQDQKRFNELKQLLQQILQTGELVFSDHSHANGRLYRAITAQEISHLFRTQHNLFVAKDLIINYNPIHEPGIHEIMLGDKNQTITYRVRVI